jgi:thiamine biosynthesis lipoprotein
LVHIQVHTHDIAPRCVNAAVDAAFREVALVQTLMSAHGADSDLARIAQGQGGEYVALHRHTIAVLRLAQSWARASGGAFDAQAAGERLARAGRRPGIAASREPTCRFVHARIADGGIWLEGGPLQIDLGGIAKGYAVDCAVASLRAMGVTSGLVNAGGDMRAFGPHAWRVDVEDPRVRVRSRRLLDLREAALATSSVVSDSAEFVATRGLRHVRRWRQCTVLARDCASADALTKWALQAPESSLPLRAAIRRAGGRLWRQ